MDNKSGPAAVTNPNVFDDEYAVDGPADIHHDASPANVQDGQPSTGSSNVRLSAANPPVNRTPSPIRRSITIETPHEQKRRTAGTVSSTRKGRINEMRTNAASSYYDPSLHRSSSSASSFVTTTSGGMSNPFADSAGPSHPYGMYPQNAAVARSSSVTSTSASTVRAPPRSYSGISHQQESRPQHPYGMYHQNVFDDDANSTQPHPQIPVGFPGLNQAGHRRIGYDGEELDILGADGHAEQLPPYSRFPEGMTSAQRDSTPIASPTSSPATEHDVRERRVSDSVSSPTQIMPATRMSESYDEKSWGSKSWRERKRTKVCFGKCPLWACVLCLILLVVFAAVIGGVVGRNMNDDDDDRVKDVTTIETSAVPSVVDASSIPTPTNIPPPPAGKYFLPLGEPEDQQFGCLTDVNQFDAWSCTVPGDPAEIKIEKGSQPNSMLISMKPSEDDETTWRYGSRAPNISPQHLKPVQDLDSPTSGPAYWFQTQYDKLVILRDGDLEKSEDSKKWRRSRASRRSDPGGLVKDVDFIWACYWNSTWIEGFIYQQSISGTSTSTAVTSPPVSVTTSTATSFSTSTDPDTHDYSTRNVVEAVSSTPAAAPDAASQASETGDGGFKKNRRQQDAVAYAQYDTEDDDDTIKFPQSIKIEERTIPSSEGVQPYCVKTKVLYNGGLGSPSDTIQLDETDPNNMYRRSFDLTNTGRLRERAEPADSCHCQWTLT